jgi:uncharacterized membrane-anchored protein YhcB (DUF1043 family)
MDSAEAQFWISMALILVIALIVGWFIARGGPKK